MVVLKPKEAQRCLHRITKRHYFYSQKFDEFHTNRVNTVRDVPITEQRGDGYQTCHVERWCDGDFISHYNKDPIWWSRTQIRLRRIIESELWEQGEKERFLSLGLSKELEEEICGMFQSSRVEKQRLDDLAERIKLAFQGELPLDESFPGAPPLTSVEYHSLRVKARYFCRSGGGNTSSILNSPEQNPTRLQYIHEQFPLCTASDFTVICFLAAVEVAKGPSVNFRFGRYPDSKMLHVVPDISKTPADVRAQFPENTFNDSEIVALAGLNQAIEVGAFDNKYYTEKLKQDNALTKDPSFKDIAEKFSQGPDYYQTQLHDALVKMTEYGLPDEAYKGPPRSEHPSSFKDTNTGGTFFPVALS